jgi:hypothetical protein
VGGEPAQVHDPARPQVQQERPCLLHPRAVRAPHHQACGHRHPRHLCQSKSCILTGVDCGKLVRTAAQGFGSVVI